MIAYLRAVKDELPDAWPVHLIAVKDATATTVPAVPYAVLEAPGWGVPEERTASDEAEELDTDIRLKVVAKSAEEAVAMLAIARTRLSPNATRKQVPMDGSRLEVQYLRSEYVGADTSVKVMTSNTHPVVGVDTYHLTSQPIPA